MKTGNVSAVDEWMTGTWMDIPFTIQEYCNAYKSHLKCLHAFEDAMKAYNVASHLHKAL
ncbi:hypothetical protein PISMIDRAFT_120265 [Pisolithus microcarpus 441]|uniref:DUF6532 domain-containing protein n=1 Tax=Pisolithus microcarpus 441 TaxID=765257 RepID=A0A0C9YXW6_9AGAM|nr:hypothetical protein BKA83DRAFT_120265 [Pisolithus microcarpus]KIK12783.1 hypothetical protein PISMIDRAFT_120265 [Pisolithus microcarpus 441]